MLPNILFVVTILLSFFCVTNASEKVPVTVYYESLCPDSRKFITTQLYPVLQTNVSKWVNLTLVPYGKSNHTQEADNEWKFFCHHGPFECHGNKIQACALHEIENSVPTPSNYAFNPVTLAFINCLMNKTSKSVDGYDFPIGECAEIANVPNYVSIENCANHTVGSTYLAALGEETQQFQKPLKSVPTIVFNNRYDKQESTDAGNFFNQILCKYITQPLEECHNQGLTLNASLLLLTLIFVHSLF